jgi:hypothetical protein
MVLGRLDRLLFRGMGKRKRSKSSKKTSKKRTSLKGPRVLKRVKYQTGKRKSIKKDKVRKALPPGLRVSRSGKKYWETRRNRSDLFGGI